MQFHTLKLLTVVGETIVMTDIAEEAIKLGASGYSLTEVNGHGSRSARNVVETQGSKTMKAEFIVSADVAEKILDHVQHEYFEHYAIIAWQSDVQVLRGEQYIASGKR